MKQLITFLSVALVFMAIPAQAVEKASDDRLDEIAQRGSHVMPFNLEQTTHIFFKNRDRRFAAGYRQRQLQ